MALRSADFYWIECDACGVKSTENSDHIVWSTVEHAVDEVKDSEWCIISEGYFPWNARYFCSECNLKLPQSNDCFKDSDE